MPQKSTDGINMMNKCWYCVEDFKEDDHVICRGSKLYHDYCIDEMDNKDHLKSYMDKYPYLNEKQIDRLIYTEGQEAFDTIDKFDWIILLEKELEMIIQGYDTEEQVKKAIESHYQNNEGQWEIESIFNNGVEYRYQTKIVVTLQAAN